MNTTVLNVKLDKDLKKRAQEVAASLGLPMSIVVASSLRDFVRTQSITISNPPRLKPEVEADLLQISADAHRGKNVSPKFTNLNDAFDWLDA
jgi:addiction module RelB/DinJ family antitoxin